jgi:hypothetical protein
MDLTFQKHFDDRYTQSREHQILDYLNQRGAAVPRVILSHAERGYLEMSHAGQNLAQWLGTSDRADLPIFDALAQSTRSVLEVSRLGIWHLDIAPRNFVISLADDQQSLRVCLIDFGNAVSALFPLQKPLWMRPSAEQHRLLRQALQQDWQSFYRRHGLLEPADWAQPFDVPQDRYQADWTRDLQVEALAARACVLAHGLGQMLISTGRILQGTGLHRGDVGASLLNLEDDEQALVAIESVLLQLQAWAQASRATPRPTRKPDASVSGRSLAPVSPAPRVQEPAAQIGSATTSAGAARIEAASAPGSPFVRAQTVVDPAPSDGPQAMHNTGEESTQTEAGASTVARNTAPPAPASSTWRVWLPVIASATVMILGWVMLDLIYQAASASKPLKTTVLALGGVALAVLGTFIGLGGLLWGSRRQAWWRRLLYVNVVGQAMLVVELWVFEMPYSVIWFASACPVIVLLLCAVRPVERDRVSSG